MCVHGSDCSFPELRCSGTSIVFHHVHHDVLLCYCSGLVSFRERAKRGIRYPGGGGAGVGRFLEMNSVIRSKPLD